jgi:hypothetical protein
MDEITVESVLEPSYFIDKYKALFDRHTMDTVNLKPVTAIELDIDVLTTQEVEEFKQFILKRYYHEVIESWGAERAYQNLLEGMGKYENDRIELAQCKEELMLAQSSLKKVKGEKKALLKQEIEGMLSIIRSIEGGYEQAKVEKQSQEYNKQKESDWRVNYYHDLIPIANKYIIEKYAKEKKRTDNKGSKDT